MPKVAEKVRETLSLYGEPIDESTVWFVQGQAVIYHKAVERIAAKAGIVFEPPSVLRAERDEAVMMVSARLGERWDWDIGEALVGVNYRVSGKQAAYVYAMALKRGRDRLVLKLIGIHGLVYSENEADDFRRPPQPASEPEPETESDKSPDWAPIQVASGTGENRKSAYQARKDGRWTPLVESLRACPDVASLIYWSDLHAEELETLPAGWVEELRSEWKARAKELKREPDHV